MEQRQYDPERLSHAYIISSPSREDALKTAREIAAAAVCTGGRPPCGVCRDCRKASENIHPDILTVGRAADDKGNIKREISVDQIRQLSADACILPNEASRKVYIIDEADRMNISAQNAALKLLEEPPAGTVFLLCVSNAGALLPTVRSRCAEIGLALEAGKAVGDMIAPAEEYLRLVGSGDAVRLCRWCMKNENMDAQSAAGFLDSVLTLAADTLCGRIPGRGADRSTLMRVCSLAEKCRAYLRVNTSVKHIFGLLAVDSIAGSGNRG